jgi:hypothetical protein
MVLDQLLKNNQVQRSLKGKMHLMDNDPIKRGTYFKEYVAFAKKYKFNI